MHPDLPARTLTRRAIWTSALLLSLAVGLLVVGWRLLWFMTDDAYIAFRYISNGILGHGYVWNAPPFRPVEGYSSFLWVVLLDAVWRVLGVEPPRAANPISLLFSSGTLVLSAIMVSRMRLGAEQARYRVALLGLVLLAVVTNRTFLASSSSGLETAMFVFLLLAWICSVVHVAPSSRGWTVLVSSTAVGLYLTRPDGLLFVAALPLLFAIPLRTKDAPFRWSYVAGISPILLVGVHLAWRRSFYGGWLPNTYHAKVSEIWPGSGMRYAASFLLEYALWIWVALALWAAIAWIRRSKRGVAGNGSSDSRRTTSRALVAVVCATLALHTAYYTVLVGGDHFEYRVYGHLIPLAFLSLPLLANIAGLGGRATVGLLSIAVLLSWPVPWTHWAKSQAFQTREHTTKMKIAVAEHWPPGCRWYAHGFDRCQFWLIDHYVCVRHQEHKINDQFVQALFPTREEGIEVSPGDYPVLAFPAVGYASWSLPYVNIIDLHGLNDFVVARDRSNPATVRIMAHERNAPVDYVRAFAPNVRVLGGGRIVVDPRARPLTARDIAEIEDAWFEASE